MRETARRPPAEHAAAVIERLAILMRGGTAPQSAWAHVAKMADDAPEGQKSGMASIGLPWRARRRQFETTERTVARALANGQSVAATLAHHELAPWRVLGCAWWVAEHSGAPIARCLEDFAGSFRDAGLAEREIDVALEGPAATAKLVMSLPPIGCGFGLILGSQTLLVLFTNPLGIACLIIGLLFMSAGWMWNRRLVAAARRTPPHPGLALDLVALGMLGGSAGVDVERLVHRGLARFELVDDDHRAVARVLALSRDAGVPATVLLRSEATLARRDARTAAAKRAAKLGTSLMVPLGVCILPAFMALGVAPLLISVMSATLSRL